MRRILAALVAAFSLNAYGADEQPRSTQELIGQLSASAVAVRREATYQLEKLGPEAKEAVPALLKALEDQDKQVWSNALAAIAAIGPDAKEAIPTLLRILESRRDRSRFRDRGQMVFRATYALSRIGSEAIPPLIQALREDDSPLRAGAAKALAGMGPAAKDAIPALVANLGHSDAEVQREVIDALGCVGPEAGPPLVEALRSTEPRQRSGAALALGGMRRTAMDAVPTMLEVLKTESDATVRANLLTVLPKVGADPTVLIPQLVEGIKDGREQIRHAAVNALLTLPSGQQPVVEALVVLLTEQNDPSLRERATYVLGRLGEHAAPAVPSIVAAASQPKASPAYHDALVQIGTAAVPSILASVEHVDPAEISVDHWAVRVLQNMGGIAAVPVSRSLTNPSASVRLLAVRALGELGPDAEAAAPALTQRLDDPDLRVRAASLGALIATHAPMKSIQPRLETAIKDPSPVIRAVALEAIGKLGEDGRALQPAVVAALKDRDESIQRSALSVVGPIFPEAVTPVVALLGSAPMKIAAIDALGRIGPAAKNAVPALAEIVSGTSTEERLHALTAIAQVGPAAKAAAASALQNASVDGDPAIRAAAIGASAYMESDSTARALALGVGFDDPEISVRQATADVVGRLGDKAAGIAPKLVSLLDRESDRTFALATLQNLPIRSVKALIELLDSPQREVKLLACDKLGKMGRGARDATSRLDALVGVADEEVSRAARRTLRAINPR